MVADDGSDTTPRLCADSETTRVPAAEVFREKTFGDGSEARRYRLMLPPKVEKGEVYPLIVFLHGAGERGTDNRKQLLYLPEQMAQPAWREQFPCYVLAPQCRQDAKWVEVDWTLAESHKAADELTPNLAAALQMLEKTLAEEQIDPKRIYLTGLSMGGFGTWDLAVRRPELFAAVAPICGGADTSTLDVLKNTPVWIAHGDADNVVPVQRSRQAVAALRAAGGKPVYVELPGVKHNSWTPSYADSDGLVPWLFRQRKP